MKSLTVAVGDIVEIRGKYRTVAKCLPLYPSDEGKGIIRVDSLMQRNMGSMIGSTIVARKINVVPAKKVIVTPLVTIPPIDERYLTDALENIPFIVGDNVTVPYFGRKISFLVNEITPSFDNEHAAIVIHSTIFSIRKDSAKTTTETSHKDVTGNIKSYSTGNSDLFSTIEQLVAVQQAYDKDVGRAIARVDYKTMDYLTVSTGDIIEIRYIRRTVVKCLPLYPSDEGKGMIRIDGLTRDNLGAVIGDKVTIKKIKAIPAENVVVTPLEEIPPIDDRYLTDVLENIPLIKGDNVLVPFFKERFAFQVVDTIPASEEAMIVNNKTIFQITLASENLSAKPTRGIYRLKSESNHNSGIDYTENVDPFSTLERLADLRQKGIVTEQEFEDIRLQVLERISQQLRNKGVDVGSVKSAAFQQSEENISDQYHVYENPKYGIKLMYPSYCEGFELDSSPVHGVARIVQFILNKGAILTIDVSTALYGSKSLDTYNRGRIFRLRKFYPRVELKESSPTTLAGFN